jgi:hypothetical protein
MSRVLLVLVVLTLIFLAALVLFSPLARLRRRLRKTHSRVVPKVNRRMVRFSVKPPKQ